MPDLEFQRDRVKKQEIDSQPKKYFVKSII